MSDLDDIKLRNAMRAYVDACDALDETAGDGEGSREFIDRADTKTLTEMVLRQSLQRLGWVAPREAEPADSADRTE